MSAWRSARSKSKEKQARKCTNSINHWLTGLNSHSPHTELLWLKPTIPSVVWEHKGGSVFCNMRTACGVRWDKIEQSNKEKGFLNVTTVWWCEPYLERGLQAKEQYVAEDRWTVKRWSSIWWWVWMDAEWKKSWPVCSTMCAWPAWAVSFKNTHKSLNKNTHLLHWTVTQ